MVQRVADMFVWYFWQANCINELLMRDLTKPLPAQILALKSLLRKNQFLDELEALAMPNPYSYLAPTRQSLTLKSESNYLTINRTKSINSRYIRIENTIDIAPDQIEETRLNSAGARFIKRSCDIIGSLIGLVLILPFWLIIAILIKLDTSGPIFYTQPRVGKNHRESSRRKNLNGGDAESRNRERRRDDLFGETFQVIKFRTMINNAEKDSGPVWASKNDSRITRVGSVLRKLRLDETPQFINVLMGDMSLVGPRPERPTFVRDLSNNINDYALRLQVKPGITGLAQIKGSYDSSPATVVRKLKNDLEYIENWSLWLDIKILFRTIFVVFSGKGAH